MTTQQNVYTRYEALTRDYRARHGDNTVVVFHLGSFDTIMSVRDGLVDIDTIADIAGLCVTQLNRGGAPITPWGAAERRLKPALAIFDGERACGWPSSETRTYIERLLAADYTVVGIKPDREVMTADSYFPHPRPTTMSTPYTRYEALTRDYRARHGDNTVVVLRVGNFDQILSIGDGLVDIDRIADIAGVRVTQLNRGSAPMTPWRAAERRLKPALAIFDGERACGWPSLDTRTYIERLLAADYRVVVVHVEYNRDMDREVMTADTFFPRPRPAATPAACAPFGGPSLHTRYDALTRDYRERYGDKTVVVIRVGSFDQILSIGDGLVDIDTIADIAGVRVTQLNRGGAPITPWGAAERRLKPALAIFDGERACGWPSSETRTYIERLNRADYTVVMVDMNRGAMTTLDTYFPSLPAAM